jgi:hypothetical protein
MRLSSRSQFDIYESLLIILGSPIAAQVSPSTNVNNRYVPLCME